MWHCNKEKNEEWSLFFTMSCVQWSRWETFRLLCLKRQRLQKSQVFHPFSPFLPSAPVIRQAPPWGGHKQLVLTSGGGWHLKTLFLLPWFHIFSSLQLWQSLFRMQALHWLQLCAELLLFAWAMWCCYCCNISTWKWLFGKQVNQRQSMLCVDCNYGCIFFHHEVKKI